MAEPRTKTSTIKRDPLDVSTFTQPPAYNLIADTTAAKKSETSSENGADIQPEPKNDKPPKLPKGKLTLVVPEDLLQRLRYAAYNRRETLATIAVDALQIVLKQLEKENGGPFPPIPEEKTLKRGRPLGSKNAR
jgi:hypothetical protein